MLNLSRNNLDLSASPYLRQHQENPVWWQEWSDEVFAEAVRQNKPVLVSVGYSTCHWCHVMAAQAFSDPKTAELLNQSFICIKVDRELRPDIDQFMMQFIVSRSGRGGWPLNVFLTPDKRPIQGLMYAPTREFNEIAIRVLDLFKHRSKWMPPFSVAWQPPATADERHIIKRLLSFHDAQHGGFGKDAKFPPHSSLLFLLYHLCVEPDDHVQVVCKQTLDAIRLRGLHDHLQGGIFRYCVDRTWTIPHYEKMLYDQAMALWNFSLAYRVFHRDEDRRMALGIAVCLDETFALTPGAVDHRMAEIFERDSLAVFTLTADKAAVAESKTDALYITAHDADTDHHEGATYLWTYDGLQLSLTAREFARLNEVYALSPAGNFEGKNHLIRKNSEPLDEIEGKLLEARRRRSQPQRDEKVLCGLNALTAIALLHAGRFLDMPVLEKKAARMVRQLLATFWDGHVLGHAWINGTVERTAFLFDAAAMTFAVSLLYELNTSWRSVLDSMIAYLETFRKEGVWYEAQAADFTPVAASWYDHPIPSSVSLAEASLIRAAFQTGRDIFPKAYVQPYQVDFYNIGVMLSEGLFHIITSERPLPWRVVSPNTIQLNGRPSTDCYRGVCKPW